MSLKGLTLWWWIWGVLGKSVKVISVNGHGCGWSSKWWWWRLGERNILRWFSQWFWRSLFFSLHINALSNIPQASSLWIFFTGLSYWFVRLRYREGFVVLVYCKGQPYSPRDNGMSSIIINGIDILMVPIFYMPSGNTLLW